MPISQFVPNEFVVSLNNKTSVIIVSNYNKIMSEHHRLGVTDRTK